MLYSESLLHVGIFLAGFTTLAMGLSVVKWKRVGLVVAATVLTAVLGGCLVVIGIMAKDSSGIQHADELVFANSSGNISLTSICTVMIAFGSIVLLSSFMGGLGAISKKNRFVSIYCCVTLGFGLYFFVTGWKLEEFQKESGPQIRRQIVDMCSEETYSILYEKLMCTPDTDGHNSPGLVVVEKGRSQCNGACEQRLEFLQWRLGGCSSLTYMCSKESYGVMDTSGTLWRKEDIVTSGECRLSKGESPATVWTNEKKGVPHSHCREKCNMDLDCRGFNYNTTQQSCQLISPNEPAKAESSWTSTYGTSSEYGPLEEVAVSKSNSDVQCFVKITARVVTRLLNFVAALSLLSMGLGVALTFGAFASLAMMCSRRRGEEAQSDNLCKDLFCGFLDTSGGGCSGHSPLVDPTDGEQKVPLFEVDRTPYFQGDKIYSPTS